MLKRKPTKRKPEPETSEEIEYEIIAPKNKFRPFDAAAQAEEAKLSEILFGGASTFLESLQEAAKEPHTSKTVYADSGIGETDSDDSDKNKKPVWVDEEDDGIDVRSALDIQGRKLPNGGTNKRSNHYSRLLKDKFTSIVGTPIWAKLSCDRKPEDGDSDEEILQTAGVLKTKKTHEKLPSGKIEFEKVNNLNIETLSEGPLINCIEFHPTSSVSLVAGQSGVCSLYAVDGKRNNKLHSVQFERFPIRCAKFTKDGNEAILGSRQKHMYSYDLLAAKAIKVPLPPGLTQMKKFILSPDGRYLTVAGKWGEVHVLSANTKEKLHVLKQDGEVTDLAFNSNGSMLMGHSDNGEVTVWDMNMRRAMHKFQDEGSIHGTSIDVSQSGQFVATGSAQGVVNVYDLDKVLKETNPLPRKSIMNLTTGIGDVKFNAQSECLAFFSTDIENSVRVFHMQSQTVYSNFPNFQNRLGHINALNFSPGSGYLALGNNKSTVSLFRLKYYKSY